MDNLYDSQQTTTQNERSLTRLIRSISLSQGQFSLILVRCNYARLQLQILKQFRDKSPIPIQQISLSQSVKTLYTTISSEIEGSVPSALMVLGLETVKSLDHLLNSTNQVRDEFRKKFAFPIVLWITDEVATKLIRLAPDFKSWAAATIKFELSTCELLEYLQQQANTLFALAELKIKDWEVSPHSQRSDTQYDFAVGTHPRRELESAWRDLQQRGYELEPALAASREFIIGQDHDARDQSNQARVHYQKSFMALLQHDSTQQEVEAKSRATLEIDSPAGTLATTPDANRVSLIRYQGSVLFHIALTYRLQAARNPAAKQELLVRARASLEQSQQVFEQAGRPDLVAGVMSYQGELLQRLQLWDELQTHTQKLIKIHLREGTPRQLAKDYGFMAEVALHHSQWSQAHKLAKLALTILPKSEPISSRSIYLLLLARSSKHLGEWDQAVEVLEIAQVGAEVDYDPQLYIDILSELRAIYYHQGEYVKAFRIKTKQREIEHQYGFRAFIGANQLQPTKQVLNPASLKAETPMVFAEEIMGNSRQKDINQLLQRLGRDDHKLIVIHGRSGVGKSSLVNAGLVPALKNISLGARNVLPVVVRNYTNWAREIERSLAKGILSQENLRFKQQLNFKKLWYQVIAQAAHRPWGSKVEYPSHFILNPASFVLKNLQRNAEQNLLTVLVFDQFEEFFFANNRFEIRAFSEFLKICLDLPFVKVVLSLREDYLHYLLECEELVTLEAVNNNILDKKIRYNLRPFSKLEATAVVEHLTQRAKFELEPALIAALVEDLADEQGEVRPIELQVVGAQLQEEGEHGITTLVQYQQLGHNPKTELIKHSIEQVIEDCGSKNEEAAWDILFALTDEKFTRPVKTRRELSGAIRSTQKSDSINHKVNPDNFLDVILESGLLLRKREKSEDRYQLLHDYLVLPIRQRYAIQEQQRRTEIQQRLTQAQADKKQAEAALQKMSQQQLIHRNRLLTQLLCLSLITATGLGFATQTAYKQKQLANIATLTAASDAMYLSHQKFDAIMESLRAAKRLRGLKNLAIINPDLQDTEISIAATLQQAVYGIHELNRLEGHSDVLWDVNFSPDGQLIVSGGVDHTLKLWTPEGKLLKTLKGHHETISSVSFSPDGQMIASSSQDQTVKLWNLDGETASVSVPLTLKGHQDKVSSVSFSPDGEMLASASEDQTVKLWTRQGRLVRTLNPQNLGLNWVSFSPDGKIIATAGNDGTAKLFTLWGIHLATLQHDRSNSAKVYGVRFSPDGQLIATVGADQAIKLWSRQGRLIRILRGHQNLIYGVKFSPDSQTLATASADKTVKLWSRDGKLLQTFQGHGDQVTNISFSPDGKILASSSHDKTVKLWRIEDIPLKVLNHHQDAVLGVSFSSDGQMLASGSKDKTVKLWSRGGHLLQTLEGYQERVSAVSFSPVDVSLPSGMSQLLATASYDKSVKLWKLEHSTPNTQYSVLHPVQLSGSRVQKLTSVLPLTTLPRLTDNDPQATDFFCLLPSRLCPLSASSRLHSLLIERSWTAHPDSLMSASFSPDGQLMVTGGKDQTIKLWTRAGRLIHSVRGHQGWVNSVRFSPDGKIIASASDDGTLKLWNLKGQLLKTIPAHNAYVLGVSFSPDGRTIASAGYDNSVKLWRRDGTLIKTLLKGSSDSVSSVVFSPDSQLIASASYDGNVRLWSRSNGTLLKTLMGHQDAVMSLSFSPDGKILASASRDKTIILWNLDLDNLMGRACEWVGDYLEYNPNVSESDRDLCDGVHG